MSKKAIFDREAGRWDNLYSGSPGERWGLLQGYAAKRVRARLDLCLSLLPSVSGKDVIELGCGPGYYGARLIAGGACWTGLDFSEKMLTICRGTARGGRMVCADVTSLPFRPDSCDVLLCVGVLSYLGRADIASLFSRVHHILRTGGLFLAQTVRFDPVTWLRCRLPNRIPRPLRIPGPFYPRNPRTIAKLLKKAGFSVRRIVPYRKFGFYPAGTVYLAEKK